MIWVGMQAKGKGKAKSTTTKQPRRKPQASVTPVYTYWTPLYTNYPITYSEYLRTVSPGYMEVPLATAAAATR